MPNNFIKILNHRLNNKTNVCKFTFNPQCIFLHKKYYYFFFFFHFILFILFYRILFILNLYSIHN